MSYRTYVNDVQIFGNNECYEQWLNFIRAQGIEVNDDNYDGYITDVMGAITTIESIVKDIEASYERVYNKSLFDFTSNTSHALNGEESLLDILMEITEQAYAFMPYAFFQAVQDDVEKDKAFSTPEHFHCYKLKTGHTIHVVAR